MNRLAFLLAVALCVAPVFLLIASVLRLPLLHLHLSPVVGGAPTLIAALAMLGALGVCLLNRRLVSLNRPARDGLPAKHVSPIPFVGSFLVVSGLAFGYGALALAVLGLAALALDPGGGLPALATLVRNRDVLFRGR
jgi:hypothetical protein